MIQNKLLSRRFRQISPSNERQLAKTPKPEISYVQLP